MDVTHIRISQGTPRLVTPSSSARSHFNPVVPLSSRRRDARRLLAEILSICTRVRTRSKERKSWNGGMKNDDVEGWKRSVTGVIRPSEWPGQRDHFIIECHYPRPSLRETPPLTRCNNIFSCLGRSIGTLIYVVLHLTVLPGLTVSLPLTEARVAGNTVVSCVTRRPITFPRVVLSLYYATRDC